ncbi:hypothetical protein V8C42DRAFT_338129, partial [Trichoderma barbatum]
MSHLEALAALRLCVEPEASVLICGHDECKRALSPNDSHATTHLWEKHKIPREARRNLTNILKTLNLQHPDQAPPRIDGSPEHPLLHIYEGFACSGCKFRSLSLRLTKQHYSDTLPAGHSCPYNSHVTRQNRLEIDHLIRYVYLQTWATGSVRQYWIIERNGSLLRPIGGQATQDHLQSVQERERNRGHNRGPGYPATAQEAAKSSHLTFGEERPWQDRTGWPETYKGRDRDLLSALAEMPSQPSARRPFILA